jgi:hypothetical protein
MPATIQPFHGRTERIINLLGCIIQFSNPTLILFSKDVYSSLPDEGILTVFQYPESAQKACSGHGSGTYEKVPASVL